MGRAKDKNSSGSGVPGQDARCVVLAARPGAQATSQTGFITHPEEVPLRIRLLANRRDLPRRTENPGIGGIRFISRRCFLPGSRLQMTVMVRGEMHRLEGVVVGLYEHRRGYQIDLGFMNRQDAFLGRMVEQACHIQAYHLELTKRQGGAVSLDQAASEWIARFSSTFPPLGEPG